MWVILKFARSPKKIVYVTFVSEIIIPKENKTDENPPPVLPTYSEATGVPVV